MRAVGLVFSVLFVVAGVLLLCGAYKRWPGLVDPPDELWLMYSQAAIKRLFGKRFLLLFTYFLGVVLVGSLGLLRVLISFTSG